MTLSLLPSSVQLSPSEGPHLFLADGSSPHSRPASSSHPPGCFLTLNGAWASLGHLFLSFRGEGTQGWAHRRDQGRTERQLTHRGEETCSVNGWLRQAPSSPPPAKPATEHGLLPALLSQARIPALCPDLTRKQVPW